MKRVSGMIAVSGLGLALSAALALAAPPALDRVPDDALVVFTIPSPQKLQKNLEALATAIEAPMPVPAIDDILAMGGFQGGLDTGKSVALAYFGPTDLNKDNIDEIDWQAAENRVVFVIPITDYAKFVENFGATPAGDGKVDTVTTPEGDDAFVRNIGNGYAAMSPDKDLVTGFTGKPAKAFSAMLGATGGSLADGSDFATIVNLARLRPVAEKALVQLEAEAKAQIEATGAAEGADLEKSVALIKWIGETVVRDSDLLVGGVSISAKGITADMVGNFKPDSYLSKALAIKGNAGRLLSKLPAGPYIWAGSIDLSNPAAKQLFKDIAQRAPSTGGVDLSKAYGDSVDSADGFSGVMGFPMGGAMAGFFTQTVGFTSSKDPAKYIAAFKTTLEASNGLKQDDMTIATKYVADGAKAGETPVDVWEMKLTPAPGSDAEMQMQQAMSFMFGPQATPAGYVAKTDGGVYMTYAKSGELMNKALKASTGDNLAADAQLKAAQESLPKDRVAEMFISTRSILDLVLPFAGIAGVQVPADKIPEKLTPISGAITGGNDAVRMTISLPADVLKTGISLGVAAQEAMEAGGEPVDQDKNEGGAGQPKF